MEEKPNYYSIIPASVRYDKRLTPNAKLLYAEITSLCNMNGQCFATNDYFAKLFCVSKVSISKWISQLVEYGYISSVINYKDGSKEILNRYLTILNDPIKEKFNTPIKEKFKDNNTTNVEYNNNITYNNKCKPTLEEVKQYCFERKNNVDAEKWFDYYTSNGWKVGRNTMKDWKAAVRTWERAKPTLQLKKMTASETREYNEQYLINKYGMEVLNA
jgi:hypothetical protein